MNHYEIESCVMRSKEGDHKELLKLLEQYKFFIFKTAAQFKIKNYDLHDLMQIAYVALLNAVQKYRIGSHTFSSYAYTAITNAFRYTARQNAKYNKELSLNVHLNNDEETAAEFLDYIEAEENLEDDVLNAENISEIRGLISTLPRDEMELIIMIYYKGLSLKSYADRMGISYEAAVRKKNRILRKLSCNIKK